MTDVTCAVGGCTSPRRHGGKWCGKHYARWLRHGDPLGVKPPDYGPVIPGERWLPVVDWEGLYEVSDIGRVRSLPRDRARGRILKHFRSRRDDRPCVKLSRNGVEKTRRIHQLVAEAFIGPRPADQETRHLDDDHARNDLANLKYGSSADNKDDQVRNGNHPEASRDHCDSGHEYTEANTRLRVRNGRTSRECRQCARDASTRTREARAASSIRCSVDDCDKPVMGKGMCAKHYQRAHLGQDLHGRRTRPTCGDVFAKDDSRKDNARIYCSLECAPPR